MQNFISLLLIVIDLPITLSANNRGLVLTFRSTILKIVYVFIYEIMRYNILIIKQKASDRIKMKYIAISIRVSYFNSRLHLKSCKLRICV